MTQAGIHSIVKADLKPTASSHGSLPAAGIMGANSCPGVNLLLTLCFRVLHLSSVDKTGSSFMHEKTDFALWNKALLQFQSVK